MQSLKNMPRVISDSEKIACLQRDMTTLKQQIASMTSKNAEVSRENIGLKSSFADLKDKFYSLELILAAKAESQAVKSLDDRHNSLAQNVASSFVSFTNDVKSLTSSSESINNKLTETNYKSLLNRESIDNLSLSIGTISKELYAMFLSVLMELRRDLEKKISDIPVPKLPVEKQEIEQMIAEAIIPAMQNVKKAMDWSSKALLDFEMFRKRLEKQVTY